MSYLTNDITEQYLDKVYDDLQKEQLKLIQEIKSGCETKKENENQKQFTLMNTILINIMRLRNLRKKIKQRIDNS